MERLIEVLVVDDQPRARKGLKALLATWGKVGCVHEAASGREALTQMEWARPDLVVMDVMMPEMDGLVTTQQIRASWPDTRIVLISMNPDYASEALSAGADAFVAKSESPRALLERLEAITGELRGNDDE